MRGRRAASTRQSVAGVGEAQDAPPFLRPAGRPGLSRLLDDRLLIGEYPTPADVAWLCTEHRVTAVVSLQDDFDFAAKHLDLAELERTYREHAVAFHRHPVRDGEADELAFHLPAIVARLHELLSAGACVYLHCNAGFNRAPTAAIAYLHAHRGVSLDEAWGLVKSRRACVPYRSALEACFAGR